MTANGFQSRRQMASAMFDLFLCLVGLVLLLLHFGGWSFVCVCVCSLVYSTSYWKILVCVWMRCVPGITGFLQLFALRVGTSWQTSVKRSCHGLAQPSRLDLLKKRKQLEKTPGPPLHLFYLARLISADCPLLSVVCCCCCLLLESDVDDGRVGTWLPGLSLSILVRQSQLVSLRIGVCQCVCVCVSLSLCVDLVS